MKTLQIAFLAMLIAQFLKLFTIKPFSLSRLVSTGGMPSSHASFVSSLTTMIGLNHGFSSDFFAIVLVFSLIIMYDATGVRRAVGKQAAVLNHLISHLSNKENLELIYEELKELIGHTPVEVIAGAFLGITIAILAY